MGRLYILFAAVSFLLPSLASPNSNFEYEDLTKLIKTENIKSVEDLIPRLPIDMRSNFTLMYKSQSLQQADKLHPRVIMFGKDAKLTCTYGGNPSLKGFDSLECYQYRKITKTFDFREVVFPNDENGLASVVFSESNRQAVGTSRCTACHGKDPRPNWEPYSDWIGAYGSHDDSFFHADTSRGDFDQTAFNKFLDGEAEDFLVFKAAAVKMTRYKNLLFGNSKYGPYSDLFKAQFEVRPNSRLLLQIALLVSEKNARFLNSLPLSVQFRFLAAVSKCSQETVEAVLTPFISAVEWTPAFNTLSGGPHFNDFNFSEYNPRHYKYFDGATEINMYIRRAHM